MWHAARGATRVEGTNHGFAGALLILGDQFLGYGTRTPAPSLASPSTLRTIPALILFLSSCHPMPQASTPSRLRAVGNTCPRPWARIGSTAAAAPGDAAGSRLRRWRPWPARAVHAQVCRRRGPLDKSRHDQHRDGTSTAGRRLSSAGSVGRRPVLLHGPRAESLAVAAFGAAPNRARSPWSARGRATGSGPGWPPGPGTAPSPRVHWTDRLGPARSAWPRP